MNTEDHNHHTNCPLSSNPQEDLREIEIISNNLKVNKEFFGIGEVEYYKDKIKQIADRNKFESGCRKKLLCPITNSYDIWSCGDRELYQDCQAKKKIQEKFKMLRRYFIFGRFYNFIGIKWFADNSPNIYEPFLSYVFQCRHIEFELEVCKDERI